MRFFVLQREIRSIRNFHQQASHSVGNDQACHHHDIHRGISNRRQHVVPKRGNHSRGGSHHQVHQTASQTAFMGHPKLRRGQSWTIHEAAAEGGNESPAVYHVDVCGHHGHGEGGYVDNRSQCNATAHSNGQMHLSAEKHAAGQGKQLAGNHQTHLPLAYTKLLLPI